jgi:heptose-I-phosphate ethanolaminephosphotransferase
MPDGRKGKAVISSFIAFRAAAFFAVPLVYWLADVLNYDQAGKTAVLGSFAILALSSWRVANPESAARRVWVDTAVALPFFIILAIEGFLRSYFGTSADDSMVTEAVFNTNSGETSEFIAQNIRAIFEHLGLLAISLGFFAVAMRFSARRLASARAFEADPARRRRFVIGATVCGAIFLIGHFNPSLRRSDPFLYAPLRYAKWHHDLELTRDLQRTLLSAQDDPDLNSVQCPKCGSRTVVFVLGESTARADWSLYGYSRETTPELEQVSSDILKFDDVISGYPGTEGSLKLIFTPATIEQPDLWMTRPDVLTIARRAGYKTFWLSNQGTRWGIISIFASHADVVRFLNRGSSRSEGSYDEVLLPEFQKALDDPAPRKFIVLHMLAAHPAYNFRYPEEFDHFGSADDRITRQLLGEGRAFWAVILRNKYDNAMTYLDHLLRTTLDMTRNDAADQPAAWLFAPDHGEDVAHISNFVGHNHRAREMWEVPMLAWISQNFGLQAIGRKTLQSRPYQLDVLDQSLFGLMGITSHFYDPREDIFSPHFRPRRRLMNGLPYSL